MKKILFICLFFTSLLFAKNNNDLHLQDPLGVVELIGDKLIRETTFKYKIELNNCEKEFDKMNYVNFGRTFTTEKPAVAYAYTLLQASNDTIIDIDIEHNDACKIWLNNQLAYENEGERNIHLIYDERSIKMSFKSKLNLKKGLNTLLVKSETVGGKEWCFLMQPPSTNGLVSAQRTDYPKFVLEKTDNVDSKISTLTNWLVIGL